MAGLRLGLPRGTFLTEDMDTAVAAAFKRALSRLGAAGARIELFDLPELAELPVVNATGGFAASEAWAWHRRLIAERGDGYDPRILARIRRGERMGAADYIELVAARARIVAAVSPPHRRVRRRDRPDLPGDPARHRRGGGGSGVQPHQHAPAAQHRGRQLPRPLLREPAHPPRRARRRSG